VQWVPGVLSPGLKCGRGVTLTANPHLVRRSRMSRSYTSSPPKRLHGVWWDSFSFTSSIVLRYVFKQQWYFSFSTKPCMVDCIIESELKNPRWGYTVFAVCCRGRLLPGARSQAADGEATRGDHESPHNRDGRHDGRVPRAQWLFRGRLSVRQVL
jgi:hypothetical protein